MKRGESEKLWFQIWSRVCVLRVEVNRDSMKTQSGVLMYRGCQTLRAKALLSWKTGARMEDLHTGLVEPVCCVVVCLWLCILTVTYRTCDSAVCLHYN